MTTHPEEAFPLNGRIDDALGYLGNVQEQLSSAKREAYRLIRERDGARELLRQVVMDYTTPCEPGCECSAERSRIYLKGIES